MPNFAVSNKNGNTMKRMILIIGLAAFGTGLPAQEAVDSLLTGDVQTDSLFQALPEVMVEGERPVVKALPGRLEYDLPRMIAQKPIDNVYDALKELPGVVEMNGGLTLGARGVTVILDGKVTNMSAEQLYSLLKSMPASRIERVEVMYNAPARYQVRGALINVRMRHRIGDPGSVQGEAFAKYDQRHEASFEERASLLYNGGKLSMDFLYSHTHGKSYNTTDRIRTARVTTRPIRKPAIGKRRRTKPASSKITRRDADGTIRIRSASAPITALPRIIRWALSIMGVTIPAIIINILRARRRRRPWAIRNRGFTTGGWTIRLRSG